MQSHENDEGITITTANSRDLEKRRRKAKSNAYLQIEGKGQREANVLDDDGAEGDIDENQNVNIKVRPSTPIKSSNKLTRGKCGLQMIISLLMNVPNLYSKMSSESAERNHVYDFKSWILSGYN